MAQRVDEERSGDAVAEGVIYTVKRHRSYEPTTRWRITKVEPPRRQVHTSEMWERSLEQLDRLAGA